MTEIEKKAAATTTTTAVAALAYCPYVGNDGIRMRVQISPTTTSALIVQ